MTSQPLSIGCGMGRPESELCSAICHTSKVYVNKILQTPSHSGHFVISNPLSISWNLIQMAGSLSDSVRNWTRDEQKYSLSNGAIVEQVPHFQCMIFEQ